MRTALIAGAGIGGLAAGIALQRAGWHVRIFERADTPREIGFGIGLASNAVLALRELGVSDAVLPQAITPLRGEIRRPGGTVIRRISANAADFAAVDLLSMIQRPALHGALLNAVGHAVVEVNSEVSGFQADESGVRVRLTNGANVTGDILVGADGFHSAVRRQLHPGESAPRASGYFAFRGASNAVAALNGLQGLWYLGRGLECGAVQSSASTIYWFLSLFADDVRAHPSDAISLRRRIGERLDAQFREIAEASAPDQMRLDELYERTVLRNWGTGRVTLLGDAAHPMLPHTGQGAAQALEDAVGLGRALRHADSPIAGLRRYEAVRSRRTRAVVLSGPRIARVTTTNSAVITAARDTVIRFVPAQLIARAFTRPIRDPNLALGPSG
jgi:2-polyprenyl-6-methoxyphenol hydroxylase-like FAD-dependent oxidoreductase